MTRWLTFLAVSLFTAPALAQGIAVLPPTVVNLEPGQGAAIGTLLAHAFAGQAPGPIFGPDVTGPAWDADKTEGKPAKAKAVAASLGADRYVIVDAVRLDQKITLHASLIESDGHRSDAEMTAASLDDMEAVSTRLAAALLTGRTPDEVRNHHTVTAQEAKPRNRMFSEKVIGFRTGYVHPVSDVDFDPMIAAMFDARLEGETYFLEIGGGLMLPANDKDSSHAYGGLMGRIGGAWYLTDGDTAPYLGVGVEPRLQFASGSAVGFDPYAQLGLMLMRESSSRLFFDVQVAYNALPVTVDSSWDPDTGSSADDGDHHPVEIGLMVGAGW